MNLIEAMTNPSTTNDTVITDTAENIATQMDSAGYHAYNKGYLAGFTKGVIQGCVVTLSGVLVGYAISEIQTHFENKRNKK